jgi:hypothetical protein
MPSSRKAERADAAVRQLDPSETDRRGGSISNSSANVRSNRQALATLDVEKSRSTLLRCSLNAWRGRVNEESEPSRAVTRRKCIVCGYKFKSTPMRCLLLFGRM